MKKLFVLFLLVALVPFTVGCSLWGHDEDRDVLETKTITLAKVFPADTELSEGNLKPAAIVLKWSQLFMMVNGNRFGYWKHEMTTAGVKVLFQRTLPVAAANEILGKTVLVQVFIAPKTGVEVPVTAEASEPISSSAETTSETSAPALEEVTEIPATVETAIATELAKTGDTIDTTKFEVSSVTVLKATNETPVATESAKATPVTISATQPATFTVTLNHPCDSTSTTWEVAVQNTAAGTTEKVITSSSTNSPLKVTQSTDKTSFTILVTPNDTYKLTVGQTYSIILVKTNATYTVSGKVYYPTIPLPRYITVQ